MRGVVVAGVVVLAALVWSAGVAVAADDYPYRTDPVCSHAGCPVDPSGFWKRECVSFVAWRLRQAGMTFTNATPTGTWGNGGHWDDRARQLGYRVDQTPSVGAVAQWNEGERSPDGSMIAGAMGHVAWVSAIGADGRVTVEHYNGLASPDHVYSSAVTRAPRYIHIVGTSTASSLSLARYPSVLTRVRRAFSSLW